MIVKNYELKNNLNYNLFLLHGENHGLKEFYISNLFKSNLNSVPLIFFEKELHANLENFYNEIFNSSFFENEKLIIVKNATDKMIKIIEEVLNKGISEEIKIVLISEILEKRSKLRNLFEKENKLISVPFYKDNHETLLKLTTSFFKSKKIPVSSEIINLLINKTNGQRQMLINELDKIEMFTQKRKKINFKEINSLVNIQENIDISELIDNCLAKNTKKIQFLISENNFGSVDSILIIRNFLSKTKRLLSLIENFAVQKNLDKTIASAKPPIFWKDKDLVKKQIKSWTKNQVEKLIIDINEIEFLIKKSYGNSSHILSDFIISNSK